MKTIYVCSPLRGDIEQNIQNAREYCKYAVSEGVLPIAPHIFFTQFLDDNNPDDRQAGMEMGMEQLRTADELWVFGDTVSEGMAQEIAFAETLGKPVIEINDLRKDEIHEQTFST